VVDAPFFAKHVKVAILDELQSPTRVNNFWNLKVLDELYCSVNPLLFICRLAAVID
jgi:hypothetical protein